MSNDSYTIITTRDTTTDGQPCYFGWLLEAPGCMGQGATLEECRADTRAASLAYLDSLRVDGLPWPEPTQWDKPVVIQMPGGLCPH